MATEKINLLVSTRPKRLAAIVTSKTSVSQFLRITRFLSCVWGGVYAKIIYVDYSDNEYIQKLQSAIDDIYPEVVLYSSKDDEVLLKRLIGVCNLKPLYITEEIINDYSHAHEIQNLITDDVIVRHDLKERPGADRGNLCLARYTGKSDLIKCFFSISCGVISDKYGSELDAALNAITAKCDANNFREYVEFLLEHDNHVMWLDYISSNINTVNIGHKPPTVLIIDDENPVESLAHCWNIRMEFGYRILGSLIMFPLSLVKDTKSINKLSEAIGKSHIKSTYAYVMGVCDNEILKNLSNRIQRRVRKEKNTKEYYVDTENYKPNTVFEFYCDEKAMEVEYSNGELMLPCVIPEISTLSSSHDWCLDLVKDLSTNRLPFDMCLRKDKATQELLNLPTANYARSEKIIGFGQGYFSVTLTGFSCKNKPPLRIHIPKEEEIFKHVLGHFGVKMLKDEKSTRYKHALAYFKNIHEASLAYLNIPWLIVDTLYEKNALTLNELKGHTKQGKGNQERELTPIAQIFLNRYQGIEHQILSDRIECSSDKNLSREINLIDSLKILTELRVIKRKWKLDKCLYCDQSYWVEQLDITDKVPCPGCSNQIQISSSINVGYELNELHRLAISEGIRPVILTSRFLYNLTRSAYTSILGAKVAWKSQNTDLDILAYCDGVLVAGECKKNPGMGALDDLLEQVKLPITIAKHCGISIFFISSFLDSYPKKFKDQIKLIAGDDITVLFLTKDDLEQGYRDVPIFGPDNIQSTAHMNMYDILHPNRRIKKRRKKGIRSISF